MLLIKKDIPNDDNEVTANFRTIYCCANCNTDLPEENKFVTKRILNPYMTEEMFEFNRKHNPEKAHLVNLEIKYMTIDGINNHNKREILN